MATAPRCGRLIAAVPTPLTPSGACDVDRLATHCRAVIDGGCDGVAVFGTSGEGPSFTIAERVEATAGLIRHGVPARRITLGVGCAALGDTITLCRETARLDLAAALVLPPYFYKDVPDDGVYRAFAQIIDGAGANCPPLLLYNIPPVSAVTLAPPVAARIATDFPQAVIGAKDSSTDWAYTSALLDAVPQIDIYVGNEPDLPALLARGGAGAICGIANLAPRLMRQIIDGGLTADEALPRLKAILEVLGRAQYVPALKAVKAYLAGHSGWRMCRPPLVECAEDLSADLGKRFAALDET